MKRASVVHKLCINGPFEGQTIGLSSVQGSDYFSVSTYNDGEVGRYILCRQTDGWEWEKKHEPESA